MLSTAPIRPYIPESDVARARKFYEHTVGLTPKEEFAGGVIYECGGAEVFMYPTSNAGTSKASQVFWEVDDVEAEVAAPLPGDDNYCSRSTNLRVTSGARAETTRNAQHIRRASPLLRRIARRDQPSTQERCP